MRTLETIREFPVGTDGTIVALDFTDTRAIQLVWTNDCLGEEEVKDLIKILQRETEVLER